MAAQIDALTETLRNGTPEEQSVARAQLQAIAANQRGPLADRAKAALKGAE